MRDGLPAPGRRAAAAQEERLGLEYWRGRILRGVLRVAAVLAGILLVPDLVHEAAAGQDVAVVVDLAAYALLLVLAFGRVPYAARAGLLVALCYAFGAGLIGSTGFSGTGAYYLFAAPVLASLFFGLAPAAGVLGLVAASFLVGGALHGMEIPGRPGTGTLVWALTYGNILMLAAGLSFAVAILLRGLEGALAEVRATRARFRSMVEHVSDGIALLDAEGKNIYLSPALEQITGYPPEARLGQSGLELVHPEDLDEARAAFADIVNRPGATASREVRLVHRDGSHRRLVITATNLLADPAVRGIVINYHDVTESRALEEQFRQAQKMDAVGRLAGGVAHDFNNLLTAISGNVELALTDLPATSPVREDLVEIQKSAAHAADLTRQLLAFSRREIARPTVVDVAEVVADVETMLRRLVGEDLEVATELDPGTCFVEIDPGQLKQVVVNLVVNGRDAMPDGGRLVIASRRADPGARPPGDGPEAPDGPGPWILLTVSDTGHGMDAATMERAFEPFFTTKEAGKGTGLGLSTVYGIVRQAGGDVRIRSAPGAGTEFRVWLPAVAGGAGETPAIPEEAEDPAPQRSKRILVVEDEAVVRSLVVRALAREGHTVLEAAGPGEALREAARHPGGIDLVLTDVVLPEMTGPELVTALSAALPDVPVLYTSGHTEDEIVRRGVEDNVIHFLPKPFTPAELVDAVACALGSGPPPTAAA